MQKTMKKIYVSHNIILVFIRYGTCVIHITQSRRTIIYYSQISYDSFTINVYLIYISIYLYIYIYIYIHYSYIYNGAEDNEEDKRKYQYNIDIHIIW